ncbi:phosphoribosylanthranilate isomerase [Candidatus Omnitrophota bacterium]
MTKIKICGITGKDDAASAALLGADLLGFVFYKGSKRAIDAEGACSIVKGVPRGIVRVGVFVNEGADTILATAEKCGLDAAQLHGDETPDLCGKLKGKIKVIKAFRIRSADSLDGVDGYDADYYLFDTFREDAFGGTGKVFSWDMLKEREFSRPVILSGGLNADNVCGAIKACSPFGVDVSSGIEASPGKKDIEKMRRFVENVKRCDNESK